MSMTNYSPFVTTRQRFLEKVETLIKDIDNNYFSGSHRLQGLRVSCNQVNSYLVILIDNRIYCAKSLLVALINFDIDADSEDYPSIWEYLKSCQLPG